MHGGIAQGVGQAMLERTVYDPESGQLLTGNLTDYAIPHADTLPALEFRYNVVPCRTNPLGVKGAGEAGAIGAPPALVNAVVDALAELGIDHLDMPLTPERLWRAMRDANAAKGGLSMAFRTRCSISHARGAGRRRSGHAGLCRPFEVTQKNDKTPVTEADLASERVIVEMLTRPFPISRSYRRKPAEAGFASRRRPASGWSTRSTAPRNLSPATASSPC